MQTLIPHNLSKILDNLNKEPFILELSQLSNIYIIGGSVRDSFLDKAPKDIDIVVEHISMNDLKPILAKYGKFNVVGESFSVIKFKPTGWIDDIDIALPRYDKQIGPGHKNVEVLSNENITILQDLSRRDITINSIAVNVKTLEILDPFNGIKDLRNKQIRCTDIHSFADDPLRIMRSLVFASRFNFDIVSSTKSLMGVYSRELKTISPERILEEFMKILNKGGNIRTMINIMYETDIDLVLFGRKMNKDIGYHEKLDVLSFFYVLAELGRVDPIKFYKTQLKGEYLISEGLTQLMALLRFPINSIDEETLRYAVFVRIKRSPLLLDVKIFPARIDNVISMMKSGIIPMKSTDIKANGDDVLELDPTLKGEEVGLVLKQFHQDALTERLKWKDRDACLRRLTEIIKQIKQ